MHERVKVVMASVFEVDPADVPDDASSETFTGWDSLRHLELMLSLEAEFGVHVPSDAMLALTSLPAIERFLRHSDGA
jgi:acyl carrier protein